MEAIRVAPPEESENVIRNFISEQNSAEKSRQVTSHGHTGTHTQTHTNTETNQHIPTQLNENIIVMVSGTSYIDIVEGY